MEALDKIIGQLSGFIWGIPLIVLLVGTHIFLTIRTRGIQLHTFRAIKLSVEVDEGSTGDISQFGALATALAATIGTGNIIGVSTAVALGGPGAVFWTWTAGIFGMATKYSEALLSVKYRIKNEKGNYVGGPMYAIERGMGKKWKWLAIVFATFTVFATFGAGCTVQSHAISEFMNSTFHIPAWVSGLVVALLAAAVVMGGVKKISSVCEKLVPLMAAFYILACIAIIIINRAYLGEAIVLIVKSAFTARAAVGGFVGSTILTACRYGVARGIFSNESGLGTAPIAAATAQTKNPVRQALVSMTGTFWDTVVVCLMTGLVIVTSVLHSPDSFAGVGDDGLVKTAFSLLPGIGQYILAIALAVFAFTTILGWCFYGERAMEYLFGLKSIMIYRVVFLIVLFIGSVVSLSLIWNFSDLMNGLMAFPNLVALLALSGVIVKETKKYLWDDNLDERMPDEK